MSTQKSPNFTKWLKRIIVILIFLEIVYLTLFNIFLNTSDAQKRINTIEPDKFQIQWESAWTPYPFRIHAKNLTIKGNSGSKEWQADVHTASATLSLPSLMRHEVKVCNVKLKDITYTRQAATSAAAPLTAINNEDNNSLTGAVEGDEKKKSPWDFVLSGVKICGHHTLKSSRLAGVLEGKIDTDLEINTKNGLLSVGDGKISITINTLKNDKDQEIVKEGKIESRFTISPVAFKEKRRGELLPYLALDAAITAQMKNLDIFDTHLKKSRGIGLSGKGALKCAIHLKNGKLLPGSRLQIDADKLSAAKRDYMLRGDGKIIASVTQKHPETLEGKILFANFQAYRLGTEHAPGDKTETMLFRGKGLTVDSKASSQLYPKVSKEHFPSYLQLTLSPVAIDNLALLQPYIPEKWHMNLEGGKGVLEGRIEAKQQGLNATLDLHSKDSRIAFDKQRLRADLDLSAKIKIPLAPSLHADLTGTRIALSNIRLFDKNSSSQSVSKPWNASMAVKEGMVILPLPKKGSADSLRALLKQYKVKEILSKADGELKMTGDISQLAWLNRFLRHSLDASLSGSGTLDADVVIREGKFSQNSRARIDSKNLEVGLLDYQFKGEGGVVIERREGTENPVTYALEYKDALMKHKSEKEAMIDDVVMRLDRTGGGSDFHGSRWDKPLHLQITSAHVINVSLYNQYFPENSPIRFLEGSADLNADIVLKPHNAQGSIYLTTKAMKMKVDDQTIAARLRVDTKIAGGEPRAMHFDITGSSIVLDQASVAGKTVDYSQDGWRADINLTKADIVWKKPIQLRSEVLLAIKDSRPIVAMIDNQKSKFAFLSKLLIVENLQGEAKINMEKHTIMVPYAFVKSDQINIGAKGIIEPLRRDGIFFFGQKGIKGTMEIKGGKRSFDIFTAQKRFDNYVIPAPTAVDQP